MSNAVYLIVCDTGLNGFLPISAHRVPVDVRQEYQRWEEDLETRKLLRPQLYGFTLIKIDLETLEVSEVE